VGIAPSTVTGIPVLIAAERSPRSALGTYLQRLEGREEDRGWARVAEATGF